MPQPIQSLASFVRPAGPDLIERTRPFHDYFEQRRQSSSWFYAREIHGTPRRDGRIRCADGRVVNGINFGSQDYLSLGSHPAIADAAMRALRDYGPHSAGSPCAQGNTPLTAQVEQGLSELLEMDHVLLFPTGWAAGYGSVIGLVSPSDHVVMDQLAHNCLQSGAFGATRNVKRYAHNSTASLRSALRAIRANDVRNGILVITEGLYSMDSDVPDIESMQQVCHEFGATLLVDVAHDLGCSGPGGTGSIGIQKMLSKVDLVMGSFSKTFASNGGFLASNAPAVRQYVRYYGSSHMFSNAMSPMQVSVVAEALRVVRSAEGIRLRRLLRNVICELREQLERYGIECLGEPSAIVPVLIGDEQLAQEMHRYLNGTEIITQFCEFPVVARSRARIRMQMMADHTLDDARTAAARIREGIEACSRSPIDASAPDALRVSIA